MKNTRSPGRFPGAAPWNKSVTGLSVCMKITAFKKLVALLIANLSRRFRLNVVGSPCEHEHRWNLSRTLDGAEHHHMHERLRFNREQGR
jgi:hypothetical protein